MTSDPAEFALAPGRPVGAAPVGTTPRELVPARVSLESSGSIGLEEAGRTSPTFDR